MALVSGMRSTLNPNAPLFVPAVYRQVEDFSPQWWELVKTSAWFCDYWLSEHPEGSFDGSAGDEDVMNLLPESFDLGFDDDFDNMEEQFAEIVALAEDEPKTEPKKPQNGLKMDVTPSVIKYMDITKFSKHRKAGPAKYQMRPSPRLSPNNASRRIHQPR